MGNKSSKTDSEDLSSSARRSCTMVNNETHGHGSGNTGSYNNINCGNTVNNYGYGNTGSSGDYGKILECLYTSQYRNHRSRVREPAEGTCTWVTKHRKYEDWLGKEKSGLLWLSADPGCGKSVTASFLIKHLQSQTNAIVCYFFFKDDNDEQRRATFALCAILHQLFMRDNTLCRYAEGEFKGKRKGFTEEVDTLWDILVRTVAEGGCGNVICVVDALDECEEGTLTRLIDHVTGLPGSQTSDIPLKFLVTSRPYQKIERQLGSPTTTIRLKGEEEVPAISADVIRVIDKGIDDLESQWEQPGGLGDVRRVLVSSADRTFLWVCLILEILKNSEDGSPEVLTEIASSAPPNIAEIYTKILDKSTNPETSRRILNIVVAAKRPLTVREMNIAFRIRPEHKTSEDIKGRGGGFEKTVKYLCGLFVRVIDEKIYLVHQTAREFLLQGPSPGMGKWQYTLCLKNSNYILADICISYLSLEDFEKDPLPQVANRHDPSQEFLEYLKKYAFIYYAAKNWANHFRDSGDQQMGLFEATRLICKTGSKRSMTWLQLYWLTFGDTRYRDFTHLMIASWFRQGRAVQQLLADGRDLNVRCKDHGTALNIAAYRQDENITKMLLDKNVKANLAEKDYNILN